MHQSLWKEYPREHVAIYDGQLVDHDTDGTALSQRIYAQYPDEFVLIRKVEPQLERTLQFRSRRFIQNPSGRDVLNNFVVKLDGIAEAVEVTG